MARRRHAGTSHDCCRAPTKHPISCQRKVGGSTPPLTTRSDQAIRLLTCGNANFGRVWPPPPRCPPETPQPRLGQSIAARGLHGPPCQPLLDARCRCRSARNGGIPAASGSGTARRASARRARRATARQGSAFADAPGADPPPSFPRLGRRLGRHRPAASRARTIGFRHSRSDRAVALTRGGGP